MMTKDEERFFKVLFDPTQHSCYSETSHGTIVSLYPGPKAVYFCINALHPTKDLVPTEAYHNENRPRRADGNVVCLRNFLIELDDMPLDDQITYVTSRIPVSTIVYSGSKSYHFIISLEEPLPDLKSYKRLARRIHAAVPGADASTKNPSRFSRIPGVLRPDTNKRQNLIYAGRRLSYDELNVRLPNLQAFSVVEPIIHTSTEYLDRIISSAVTHPNKMMADKNLDSRNRFMYWLGCRLTDANYPPEQRAKLVELAYNNLQDTSDFTFEEACQAARVRGGNF